MGESKRVCESIQFQKANSSDSMAIELKKVSKLWKMRHQEMPMSIMDSSKSQSTVELSDLTLFPDKQDPPDWDLNEGCQVCPPTITPPHSQCKFNQIPQVALE